MEVWSVEQLQPSRAEAEAAKRDLLAYRAKLKRISERMAARGMH